MQYLNNLYFCPTYQLHISIASFRSESSSSSCDEESITTVGDPAGDPSVERDRSSIRIGGRNVVRGTAKMHPLVDASLSIVLESPSSSETRRARFGSGFLSSSSMEYGLRAFFLNSTNDAGDSANNWWC